MGWINIRNHSLNWSVQAAIFCALHRRFKSYLDCQLLPQFLNLMGCKFWNFFMFDVKVFLKLRVVNLQQIKIEKDHSQNQKRRLVYTESTVKTLQTDNSTIGKVAGLSGKLAGHLSNKSSNIILFYLTHFPTKSSQLIFLQFAATNDQPVDTSR